MIIHWKKTRIRALRLFVKLALTLYFLALASAALAASELDEAFSGYVTRMILALALLGALGYAAAKFLPGRFGVGSRSHLKIISALSLGREMIYIIKTGPEVVAFLSGRTGAVILGRWSAEEWDDYEAVLDMPGSNLSSEKKQ
jgi:hypothetical protein